MDFETPNPPQAVVDFLLKRGWDSYSYHRHEWRHTGQSMFDMSWSEALALEMFNVLWMQENNDSGQ